MRDRAGIDFRQWFDRKHGSGNYFLSREKDNMNLDVVGNHPFDTNAKTVQARMLCLTHNLMSLMEETIRTRCGVSNQAEFKRREQREAGKPAAPSSARIAVQRLTQRDWHEAIALLAKIYSRMRLKCWTPGHHQ